MQKALVLSLCLAQSLAPSEIAVVVNGKTLPSQRPARSGSDKLAYNPLDTRLCAPSALHFTVPEGALRAGVNEITLTLSGGSWIIYDAVQLGPLPVSYEPRLSEEERAEAFCRNRRGGLRRTQARQGRPTGTPISTTTPPMKTGSPMKTADGFAR